MFRFTKYWYNTAISFYKIYHSQSSLNKVSLSIIAQSYMHPKNVINYEHT